MWFYFDYADYANYVDYFLCRTNHGKLAAAQRLPHSHLNCAA
jgi:hypothetical protein